MYYCDFIDTGKLFNNRKIYKCKYCNTTLALENPNSNIICFKRQNEFFDQIDNQTLEDKNKSFSQHIEAKQDIKEVIKEDLYSKALKNVVVTNENTPDNLCSKEEIDARLKICQSCEYYQNDSCLLCGCTIIRDKNFNNKLAHKDKSCPVNKWVAIT